MTVYSCILDSVSQLFLYANDLKIVVVVHSLNDCYTLQNDTDSLATWCVVNKLTKNIDKCCFMSFSRKKTDY